MVYNFTDEILWHWISCKKRIATMLGNRLIESELLMGFEKLWNVISLLLLVVMPPYFGWPKFSLFEV